MANDKKLTGVEEDINSNAGGGGNQQPAQKTPYQTTYKDPNGQEQTGYIIDGRTYKDAAGTTEVEGGSVVTDASGRQWTKPITQQPAQQPAYSVTPVKDPNTPYQTTYTDADGNIRVGYIINGTTYTDAAGTNPVGVGSIVTDQSGRKWLKGEQGSSLYAEKQAPTAQIPARKEENKDYAANLRELLTQWKSAAEAGVIGQIDYATQQAITELERALEDAQGQFKTQQDQITSDQLAAQDNAALYAEMRGDKGGIGQAQYNAIANAAAINRQTVASQQTKLSTDTARQIADLRAQGEFEKADKILEVTQTYLSQLMSIEQWALEYGLSVEQFNEAVRQWEAEYALALKQYETSVNQWQTEFDTAVDQWEAEYEMSKAGQISDIAAALLDAGIELTDEQLKAMGITREQANAYLAAQQVTGGGGGGGGGGGPTGIVGSDDWCKSLYKMYGDNAVAVLSIPANYEALGLDKASAASALANFQNWKARYRASLEVTKNPGSDDQYVTVPGYGTITYDDAAKLRAEGKIKITGQDENGNPVYQTVSTTPLKPGTQFAV